MQPIIPNITHDNRLTLQDHHILTCEGERPDGSKAWSKLDLNECLGNDNGRFQWGGSSFANEASQVLLTREGNEAVPMLHAQLDDRHGSQQSASLDLRDRIRVDDGELVYTSI